MSPRKERRDDEDLEALIEEAIVDAYTEDEQAVGFLTMLEEEVEFPFEASVLGVSVKVTAVDLRDTTSLSFRCQREGRSLWVDVRELELPSPAPAWARWVRAWRRWREEG